MAFVFNVLEMSTAVNFCKVLDIVPSYNRNMSCMDGTLNDKNNTRKINVLLTDTNVFKFIRKEVMRGFNNKFT